MKNLLYYTIFLYLSVTTKADCPSLGNDYFWGYWGVNFDQTSIPNVVFDSEDPHQLELASVVGKKVFFYMQNILFDFTAGNQAFSLKENWQDIFDENYGDSTAPTNPYNITGLTGDGPNGFFLGSQLIYYNLSLTDLSDVADYIKGKYPTATISWDEDIRLFDSGFNYHNIAVSIPVIPSDIDLLSVSHFWPDNYYPNYPTVLDIYHAYENAIYPLLINDQKFVWSVPMYNTDTFLKTQASCHPPNGVGGCPVACAAWAVSSFSFLCRDQPTECFDEPDLEENYIHSDRVRGLWAWHWDQRPNLYGYEDGIHDTELYYDYEQFFGSMACSLVSPSVKVIINSTLILITLIISSI